MFFLDLAYAQMALGRQKEALEAVGQAVDVSAEDKYRVGCRCSRATLLAQMDRFAEAEAECRAMLKEYKEEALVRQVRFALSAVCSMAKKHEASEEQLQKILEADPRAPGPTTTWATSGPTATRTSTEAERMIRKALELDAQQRQSNDALGLDADRDNAAYVDSLGWVLFRRGRLKEAREQLEKAAGLPDGADDPTVWDHLGDVCHRLGEAEQAVRAWKKALALFEAGRRKKTDERYKDIQQKLKHLQANR